jgi:hypothetical protein
VEAPLQGARAQLLDGALGEMSGDLQQVAIDIATEMTGFDLLSYFSWDNREAREQAISDAPFVELIIGEESYN